MSPPLHWLMLSCCSWCWRSRPWNGLSWEWRSGAGPAAWGGDWGWEEWYGGGVSTRESMKGNTLLQYTTVTHHTHLQGPKGEESNLGNANLRCATGGRSWMRRRDLLIHWESMNIKVIVHLILNSLCEDQEGEKVKGSTKGYYTIQTTNLLPSCTLPPNPFLLTLLLSLPHSSSPS